MILTTALIVQDLQNDVISKGGAFADSGAAEHANSQQVVEHVRALAQACRGAGCPVVHVWFLTQRGAPEQKQNAPLFRGLREAGAVVRDTWGAAPVAGLEPQPGDYVVEKMRMNAFYQTRLDILLRGLDVETIVLAGAWTNMSVEHTARHGADAGYEVVVCSDGTSTINDEWQQAALNYAMQNVGQVASCGDVSRALAADHTARRKVSTAPSPPRGSP